MRCYLTFYRSIESGFLFLFWHAIQHFKGFPHEVTTQEWLLVIEIAAPGRIPFRAQPGLPSTFSTFQTMKTGSIKVSHCPLCQRKHSCPGKTILWSSSSLWFAQACSGALRMPTPTQCSTSRPALGCLCFPPSKYCILAWKSEWTKPGSRCIDSFWCHPWLVNRGFSNVSLNWTWSWLYSLSSFWLSYEERQRSSGFSPWPARNLHAFLKTFASLWWAYLDIKYDIFPLLPSPHLLRCSLLLFLLLLWGSHPKTSDRTKTQRQSHSI